MTDPSGRPAAAYPYDLLPKLAEWLVHGTLSSPAAEAFLSLVAEQEARRIKADDAWAAWLHGVLRHLMLEHVERLRTRRELAEHAIKRTVRPMVDRRRPSNQLLAEAHNCNADQGYALDEAEVHIAVAANVHKPVMSWRRPNGR
jgi:hypothetical protein